MDFKSAEFVLDQMQVLQQQICDPLISSKYLAYKNQLLIREGKLHESYISVLETIDFLTSKGYCKAQLIREKLNLASLKYQNGDVFSALIDLESIKKKCKLYALQELQNFARLLQALILVHQGNLVRSAQLLKKIEDTQLFNMSLKLQGQFFAAKAQHLIQYQSCLPKEDPKKEDIQVQALKAILKAIDLNKQLNNLDEL